jgi:3-phosphoshikimate 1-carboxyvinyltransferase
LDCGNSGSTMRMLAGLLATQDFSSTLTGDASLSSRPMARIIEPLAMMGARIASTDGHAPLRIEGRQPLNPIRYELPVASAQLKSCLLLAGLGAEGRSEVIERVPTRDHTERMLQWFGAPLESSKSGEVSVHAIVGPAIPAGRDVSVPGDISSAAYFIAAAALLSNSDLRIEDVGLNATRVQFLTELQSADLAIEISEESEEANEPRGSISVKGKRPEQAFSVMEIAGALVPALIDELPLLGVLGSQLGGIRISGAKELRTKESDRISATVTNLRAMGATVEEFDDGFAVDGPVKLRGAELDSFGDHRIAMAFAIAALVADGESIIKGSECVSISFPGFFEQLESVILR